MEEDLGTQKSLIANIHFERLIINTVHSLVHLKAFSRVRIKPEKSASAHKTRQL